MFLHFLSFRCSSPDQHYNKLLLSVDLKDFVCTHANAKVKTYSRLKVVLEVIFVLVVLIVAGAILVILRRRGLIPCTQRQTVGRYSHVNIEPNRAEMEWDDKDLDHVWTTTSSDRQDAPRGP
jgi:hypothetical protein